MAVTTHAAGRQGKLWKGTYGSYIALHCPFTSVRFLFGVYNVLVLSKSPVVSFSLVSLYTIMFFTASLAAAIVDYGTPVNSESSASGSTESVLSKQIYSNID